jgi:hypothetical protein
MRGDRALEETVADLTLDKDILQSVVRKTLCGRTMRGREGGGRIYTSWPDAVARFLLIEKS